MGKIEDYNKVVDMMATGNPVLRAVHVETGITGMIIACNIVSLGGGNDKVSYTIREGRISIDQQYSPIQHEFDSSQIVILFPLEIKYTSEFCPVTAAINKHQGDQ